MYLLQVGPVLPGPVDRAHGAPLHGQRSGSRVDVVAPLARRQLTLRVQPEHLVLKVSKPSDQPKLAKADLRPDRLRKM
jgi:hypothetical protein